MKRLLLVLLLAQASASSAANLIGNGGLEVTPAPGGTTVLLPTGSTALSPWSVTAGNVEAIGQFFWEPAQGGCSLSLNGSVAGTIAQSFPTVSGATYKVSFSMSGDALTEPAIKNMRVRAAGQSQDFQYDTAPAWHWDMKWARRDWTFTANASTTTLEFQSLDNADTGPAIDSVSVDLTGPLGSEAPAPAPALALSGAVPNPSSGVSRIAWSLPRPGHVRLVAYDVRGRETFVLEDGDFDAGLHHSSWNVRALAAGVYVLRLSALGEVRTQRTAVVR